MSLCPCSLSNEDGSPVFQPTARRCDTTVTPLVSSTTILTVEGVCVSGYKAQVDIIQVNTSGRYNTGKYVR